jgi:long-chain acyl-CoA synthetase
MLSHRNLCFNISEMRRMVLIGEEDSFLSVLPLHHIYECTCGFLCPLSAGCAVAFSQGLEWIGKDLKEVRPTVMICIPAIVEGMYRRIWEQICSRGAEGRVRRIIDVTNALPNLNLQLAAKQKSLAALHKGFGGRLRLMLSGGSAVSAEAVKGLRDLGIHVLQGYGSTECAPVMALNRDTLYRDGAVGLSTPNALLDIADMQEDGIGEIRYRGDSVMLGYFRLPRRTREVIRGGWYYTGDMGYLDEDGFLHVLGRLQNVITTSDGKKIFPEELEALLRCSAFVKEAVVVPIQQNGEQEPCVTALLYPDMERISERYGDGVDREQIEILLRRAVAEVNGSLPDYKRIGAFRLRETEFPKTPTRKIKRAGLV